MCLFLLFVHFQRALLTANIITFSQEFSAFFVYLFLCFMPIPDLHVVMHHNVKSSCLILFCKCFSSIVPMNVGVGPAFNTSHITFSNQNLYENPS